MIGSYAATKLQSENLWKLQTASSVARRGGGGGGGGGAIAPPPPPPHWHVDQNAEWEKIRF